MLASVWPRLLAFVAFVAPAGVEGVSLAVLERIGRVTLTVVRNGAIAYDCLLPVVIFISGPVHAVALSA